MNPYIGVFREISYGDRSFVKFLGGASYHILKSNFSGNVTYDNKDVISNSLPINSAKISPLFKIESRTNITDGIFFNIEVHYNPFVADFITPDGESRSVPLKLIGSSFGFSYHF